MKNLKFLFLLSLTLFIIMCCSVFAFAASDQQTTSDDLLQYAGIAVVPLIVGIAEVFKKSGFNAKFVPIVNIILGIGAGILITQNILQGLFVGAAVGLSASGLYSSTKNVIQGIKSQSGEVLNE